MLMLEEYNFCKDNKNKIEKTAKNLLWKEIVFVRKNIAL